jgi:shikimate 5-dehydrogenase
MDLFRYKVSVIDYLDETAPDAAIIGTVNTVRRVGDKLIGENTDDKSFLCGVCTDASVDPKGKRVVMLGAGGAARAIVTALALAGASDVLVLNRLWSGVNKWPLNWQPAQTRLSVFRHGTVCIRFRPKPKYSSTRRQSACIRIRMPYRPWI